MLYSRRELLAIASTLPFIGCKEVKMPDNLVAWAEMQKRAKAIADKAYAPYSKYRVGACVKTVDGELYDGCNVENASYGLTICAERNAIFHAVAQGMKQIESIAIYVSSPVPGAPCGACRQVINEFGPDATVMSICDGPDVLFRKLSELLPDAFGPANLK